MAEEKQLWSKKFEETVFDFLEAQAETDEILKMKMASAKKNIKDCCTYIINQVKESGQQGFTDDEVFGMAMHYYDENDIDVGSPVKCEIVINKDVQLTEEELAEARKTAKEKVISEGRTC